MVKIFKKKSSVKSVKFVVTLFRHAKTKQTSQALDAAAPEHPSTQPPN
jgi:hypothetical protein